MKNVLFDYLYECFLIKGFYHLEIIEARLLENSEQVQKGDYL